MNNQEAKFILASYRPDGIDAADPLFAEALKQAQNDPALSAWLASEQALDGAIAAKLRSIAPPPGLREEILAGGRMSRPRRGGWRSAFWLPLAVAAGAMMALSVLLWQRQAKAQALLVNFAMSDLSRESEHGGHGEQVGTLQAALQDPARPVTTTLPIDFAALAKTGCRTLTVGGHSVLEVCFERDGTWFHCYIARVADFPLTAAHAAPSFASSGNVSAMTWVEGAHRIVIASLAGRTALEQLL